jgi:hypothetical protein
MARKVVYCPYCSAINGTVKKAGALKIIHDKFRAKKTAEEMEKWKKTFTKAVEAQKELAMYLNKAAHEELNPLKVLDLFRRVSDEASTHHRKIYHHFISRLGLRATGPATCMGSAGRVYLAIFIRAPCLHSTFGSSRWCLQ